MKLRCGYAIHDDLHAFAEAWISGGQAMPLRTTDAGTAQVLCLYREGAYQVELCCMSAGAVIPPHVHPHADTIEVGVFGAVRLSVNGADPYADIPDDRLADFTRMRGIRINATDVHGGRVVGAGAAFLSIQRWAGDPQSVLTDYRGEPLGGKHKAML